MTPEELQALVDELKAEKESLVNKNKELLSEVKKERNKSREIDADKYYAMVDELEAVKAENSKLNGELKLKGKEFEKLTATIGEKDATLQKLIIEDGITKALTEAGVVNPRYLRSLKAELRAEAELRDNQAFIGGKPLAEFMTEFMASDGKDYIPAANNSGSGAGGGTTTSGGNIDISKMTPNEMMRVGREQKQQ